LAETVTPFGAAAVAGIAVCGAIADVATAGGIAVGATVVVAGAHPLSKTISITNDRIDEVFFFKADSFFVAISN